MESKIYKRQISKQSMSKRVVDLQQMTRHYTKSDLKELYTFSGYDDAHGNQSMSTISTPKEDPLLAQVIRNNRSLIVTCYEHDSLLENRPDEELTEAQQASALTKFESFKADQLKVDEDDVVEIDPFEITPRQNKRSGSNCNLTKHRSPSKCIRMTGGQHDSVPISVINLSDESDQDDDDF